MKRLTMSMMLLAPFVGGCATDAGQTIEGRINTSATSQRITSVRAVDNGDTIEVPVRADGSFSINLPAGDQFRLELLSEGTSLLQLGVARDGSGGGHDTGGGGHDNGGGGQDTGGGGQDTGAGGGG